MPNSNQGQLTIWGRANSVNVQKVLWCLRELDLAYERIDAGMAFGSNREPDYLAMNPNGRVPTLVDGDFVLWESNSIMRYLVLDLWPGIADLSAGAEAARRRRPLAGLDAVDACSRSIVRCSGRWCEPRSNSATWLRSRRMPTRRPCNGASSTRSWRRGASSKAMISRSPISRSAPMHGAGSGSKASPNRSCAHLERWFAQFAGRPDFSNSSRRRCRDASTASLRPKARPLEQHNTNDQRPA